MYRTFGNHQEDQEGQKRTKHGVLEDFGCLDGYFGIVTRDVQGKREKDEKVVTQT